MVQTLENEWELFLNGEESETECEFEFERNNTKPETNKYPLEDREKDVIVLQDREKKMQRTVHFNKNKNYIFR